MNKAAAKAPAAQKARSGADRRPARGAAVEGKPAASRRPSSAGPGNQALQSVLRARPAGPGPHLHESPQADRALAALGAPGAAAGQNILLARHLSGPARAEVLRHELRHTAQTGGADVDPGRPLQLGPTDDVWERAARGSGPPGRGADPQVVRRFGPEEEQQSSQPYGECRPGEPVSAPPEAGGAGECSVDDSTLLSGATEPGAVSSQADQQLSSEPGPNVCESPFAEASFDPEAIDVEGMRNDTLNVESLRVDAWIEQNALVSPQPVDAPAYRRLQARLKQERNARVQTGHLWLTTAIDHTPEHLYMLVAGEGATNIIEVYSENAMGVPDRSYPGPIMTRQQFDDHMASLGVPVLTEEQYYERLRETARQIAPQLLVAPGAAIGGAETDPFGERYRGYTGGFGHMDPLGSSVAQLMPWGNIHARVGEYGEGYALRALAGQGAFGYESGRYLWNARNSPRVLQNPFGGYDQPRGLDILRPIRRARDATPAMDVRVLGGDLDYYSIKVRNPDTAALSSPSRRTQYSYYLESLDQILDPAASNLGQFRDRYAPRQTMAEVSARSGLLIPDFHAADVQAFLRDPHGFDLTEGGNASTIPNWAMRPESGPVNAGTWRMRSYYANAPLSQSIDLNDGGQVLRTGADVFSAFRSGRIDEARFNDLVEDVANQAAARVRGFEMSENAIRWYESFRGERVNTPGALHTRSAFTPAMGQILEAERVIAGDPAQYTAAHRGRATRSVAHSNALRGAGMNVGVSLAGNLLLNENADLSDPRYQALLAEQLAVEGIANYGADLAETTLRSRIGFQMLEEGVEATAPRMLAGRMTARALPGVADALIEIHGVLSEEREHSVEEVVVRTGRAAVIGAGSAWAGAAVGTAIGGPVGFVVGFGVGAAVGWLANKILPGSGEDYARAEAERRRREELERRQREARARLEALRRRLQRLNTPLDAPSAGSVGVEAMYGMPTDNPMFMACEPGVQPTIGELEAAYLQSVLQQAAGPPPGECRLP